MLDAIISLTSQPNQGTQGQYLKIAEPASGFLQAPSSEWLRALWCVSHFCASVFLCLYLCLCVSVFLFVYLCVCLCLCVFMLLHVGSTFSNGESWLSTDCRFYLPPSANVPVTPALHRPIGPQITTKEKKTCAIWGCFLFTLDLIIAFLLLQVDVYLFVLQLQPKPAFCNCSVGQAASQCSCCGQLSH